MYKKTKKSGEYQELRYIQIKVRKAAVVVKFMRQAKCVDFSQHNKETRLGQWIWDLGFHGSSAIRRSVFFTRLLLRKNFNYL